MHSRGRPDAAAQVVALARRRRAESILLRHTKWSVVPSAPKLIGLATPSLQQPATAFFCS